MKKNLNKKNMNIILFYIIVFFTGIIGVPTLGIIAPTFIICGIIIPIAGLINLIFDIFKIKLPFILFQMGSTTLNPILALILSVIVGIWLYIVGKYAWKLLLNYLHIVSKKRQELEM